MRGPSGRAGPAELMSGQNGEPDGTDTENLTERQKAETEEQKGQTVGQKA